MGRNLKQFRLLVHTQRGLPCGVQMTMMGVLGEYLWRALDEAKRRPRFLIEATTGDDAAGGRVGHERS